MGLLILFYLAILFLIVSGILIFYSTICKKNNTKCKNKMISGWVFAIIGLILLFPFAGLVIENLLEAQQPDEYLYYIEYYEYPGMPYYLNITEEQMVEFPNLKENISNGKPYSSFETDKDEYDKIMEFFEINNYNQTDLYFRYQSKYYWIKLICEKVQKC